MIGSGIPGPLLTPTHCGVCVCVCVFARAASMKKVSFRKALRRYPPLRHASTLPLNPSVRVTTLPNKIRVATENTPGHFSSVGLYIDAGARYETLSNSGVSHFLDRMAFKVCIFSSKFDN